MPEFIQGLDLCQGFFEDCVRPILKKYFPELRYSAGLLGYGSDVLGYDDPVSADHMWGPRLYVFLTQADIHLKEEILSALSLELPYIYRGYSVNFSEPDPRDGGIRHAAFISKGKVAPLIWVYTPEAFRDAYLGRQPQTPVDWLTLSEHRLLGFTAGRLFADMLNLQALRDSVACYPSQVKLYLLASQWELISQEQAFVKRCGVRGDDIGSRICCTRMAERLMRLCFLYQNRYAPYSKWFGTAFSGLPVNPDIQVEIQKALAAGEILERERHLVTAQSLVAQLHNQTGLTDPVSTAPQLYFSRDIQVIHPEKIAEKLQEKITEESLRKIPPFGAMSQVGNFVTLSDGTQYQPAIKAFYQNFG